MKVKTRIGFDMNPIVVKPLILYLENYIKLSKVKYGISGSLKLIDFYQELIWIEISQKPGIYPFVYRVKEETPNSCSLDLSLDPSFPLVF